MTKTARQPTMTSSATCEAHAASLMHELRKKNGAPDPCNPGVLLFTTAWGAVAPEGVCMLWPTLYRQKGLRFHLRQIRRTVSFS